MDATSSGGAVPSVVTVEAINQFLAECGLDLGGSRVEEVSADFARCRWIYDESGTRPGGSISGPTIMRLCDLAAWIAVFTRAGIVPMAVTWDLHTSFLRPAIGRDLVADARQLKFGRLAYSEVSVFHPDEPERPVAHATVTYAVPKD